MNVLIGFLISLADKKLYCFTWFIKIAQAASFFSDTYSLNYKINFVYYHKGFIFNRLVYI